MHQAEFDYYSEDVNIRTKIGLFSHHLDAFSCIWGSHCLETTKLSGARRRRGFPSRRSLAARCRRFAQFDRESLFTIDLLRRKKVELVTSPVQSHNFNPESPPFPPSPSPFAQLHSQSRNPALTTCGVRSKVHPPLHVSRNRKVVTTEKNGGGP